MQRNCSCERARAWASIRLDEELPAFQVALLEEHLRGCLACRHFVDAAASLTIALRSAALLERPMQTTVLLGANARLNAARTRFAIGAASAACAVAVFFAFSQKLHSDGSLPLSLSAEPHQSRLDTTEAGRDRRALSPPLGRTILLWARALRDAGQAKGDASGVPIL
jgi:hypothetical protein